MANPKANPASGQPAPKRPVAVTVDLANDRAAIERLQAEIVSHVDAFNFPKAAGFAIRLALHEAVSNAFMHGHKDLPPSVPVSVTYRVDAQSVFVSVEDKGPGFDPDAVPDPTLEENLEVPSGRGLMLIRAYMSQVKYANGGRRLEMTFRRPATKPS